MTFRVTQSGLYSSALRNLRKQTTSLGRLQEQMLSGKQLLTPSDDPTAAKTIILHKSAIGKLESRLTSIGTARNWLSQGEVQLTDAQEMMTRAKEIALAGRQSTDPTELRTLAAEVDQILGRMVSIANTKDQGLYLFGGNQSDAQPYSIQNGRVVYGGGTQGVSVSSGDGVDLPMIVSGSDVFTNSARGATIILGNTGLKPGSGTDSGVGQSSILIRNTSTTFAAGSGITSGTGAAAGDTVLGAVGTHTLTIRDESGTGAYGVISINGGPEVPFTNGDTNLKLQGAQGEVVYVNTTAITAGFNGTVGVGGDGTISLDGGVTEVPLTYATNVQLQDPATGQMTNLDTSAVRVAGTAQAEYTGTSDVFSTLSELRDTLLNASNLPSGELQQAFTRRIGDIDRLADHMYDVRGELGVVQLQLDKLQTRTEDLRLATKQSLSDVEQVDVTDVVVKLQEAQNQMQFALAAVARLNDVSLLNYMQ